MTIASPLAVALLGAATTLAVALGLLAPAFARRRELSRRLDAALRGSAISADLAGRRRTRGLTRAGAPAPNRLVALAESWLERAALDLTAGELFGALMILGFVGAIAGFALTVSAVGAAIGFIAGGSTPLVWIRFRHSRRQRAFRSQLADNIALLAASVRAGHSLMQAFEQVAKEAPEPSASAFSQVVREIGVGAAQEEALERLVVTYPTEDLELIVTAMNVQRQVGGSLARVLDDLAATLRERTRIEGDINALTAQQRYSAYVLALLPVFVAAALFFVSRDYVQLLFEGMLRIAAIVAGLMIVLGFFAMRRIATIDV